MADNENIVPEPVEETQLPAAEKPFNNVRRRKRKRRWLKAVLIIFVLLLLMVAAAGVVYYYGFVVPYEAARNTMPTDGALKLSLREDGSVLMQWPESEQADYYELTMWKVGEDDPFFARKITDGAQCVLEELPGDGELVVRVRSWTCYETLTEEKVRAGEDDLVIRASFAAPTVDSLTWEVDPDRDQLDLHFDLLPHQVVKVKAVRSDGQVWELELDQNHKSLLFGDGKDFPMPTYEQTYTFSFSTYLQREELHFEGVSAEGFQLIREDLLGTELQLETIDEGNNRYTLTWNETKGEYYEVQKYSSYRKEWETVAKIGRDEERTYNTGHLKRYSTFRYRVVAVGGQTLPDSEFAAVPAETEMTTGASLIYSTVWPTRKLDVYKDVSKTETLGTAKAATAFCVLDEEEGLFLVRFGDELGYIDSNYCMINLPEYIGDLVSYRITNSVEAIYMVHDYPIDEVTGEVVVGYEKVFQWDGTYLVPLLYPTAKKLEKAAFTAQEKGYRLLIYDSYRPGKASNFLRDASSKMLPKLIPVETWTKEPAKDMPDIPIKGTESDPALNGGETEEIQYLTYEYLMTDNGRIGIGHFIAGYGSRHNFGVALDLTLEKLKTREEIVMQSAIHDLSHYSGLAKNNKEAKVLSNIMLNSGFGGLSSEWWHFQDHEALNELGLTAMMEGVSPECWMATDFGWRYRKSNGTYYMDKTVTIDKVSYKFDENGYVVEPASEEPKE